MAWSNRTNRKNTKKETVEQQAARYKRQQEKQRKLREQRQKFEEEMKRPGSFRNPLTPKFCRFSEYPTIHLSYRQARYHGTTRLVAHLKGHEPTEFTCAMQGHCRKTTITKEQYDRYVANIGGVRFGDKHYKHPITVVPYENFIKFYTVYEQFDAYLD